MGHFELILSSKRLVLQEGRCAISDIPLNVADVGDWLPSIQRLDNSQGYTWENSCMICSVFQSSDHGWRTSFAKDGSRQSTSLHMSYSGCHAPMFGSGSRRGCEMGLDIVLLLASLALILSRRFARTVLKSVLPALAKGAEGGKLKDYAVHSM
eukprot:5119980-Amphidinium_carterae.2